MFSFFFIIIQLGLKQNLQIGSIRHGNPSMLCLVITQISVQFADLKVQEKGGRCSHMPF